MTKEMNTYTLRAMRAARDLDERDVDALVRRARREGADDQDIVDVLEDLGAAIDVDEHPWALECERSFEEHADGDVERATTLADAIETIARGYHEPGWYHIHVSCSLTGEHDSHTWYVPESEPDCVNGDDHDWVVVDRQLHGGGVVIREECRRCDHTRTTDTWAQSPLDGTQGHTMVTYDD